jgi:Holliday junction resolvasome RuvABC endonuclease subunit
MKIIGIDLGKKNIGIALLETRKQRVLKYETLHPVGFVDFYDTFKQYILDNNPSKIGIEKPYYSGASLKHGFSVIEMNGIVKLVAEYYDVDVIEVSASHVKKEFTGNGKANKGDMINQVREKYGIKDIIGEDNHSADAIAIAEVVARDIGAIIDEWD